jgi:hypothetical protein
MTVEVIGVDHIFVSVGDLGRSEEFYDRVMAILGFRKGEGTISGPVSVPRPFIVGYHLIFGLRFYLILVWARPSFVLASLGLAGPLR